MRFEKGEIFLLIFNLIYIIVFTTYYLIIKNYEFLWYVMVLVFFAVLIILTIRKSNFDYIILGGLSIWGLLHMAGGGVIIQGKVLYAFHLIPIIDSGEIFILKYDQLVHFFGFGVSTLVGFHLLKPYLNDKVNWKIVYSALVLIGMGFGALNELVEFIAVILFDRTGVGGYYNSALDLTFNTLGAITAVVFIHLQKKFKITINN